MTTFQHEHLDLYVIQSFIHSLIQHTMYLLPDIVQNIFPVSLKVSSATLISW